MRVEQVAGCLDAGLDPNTEITEFSYPLLQVAIANSSPEVVEVLIAGGADIEYRDSRGRHDRRACRSSRKHFNEGVTRDGFAL